MAHELMTMILTLGVISFKASDAEPLSTGNKWPRPNIIPQDYQVLLLEVNQKLRNLETIRHLVARSEISLQSLSTRMDLIETRLQTVQNSYQHTFEAISTAVKSSEMKYELLMEQLSRKLEAGMDRITHRLSTIESRNEAAFNKVQSQIDMQLNRVESKQNIIGNDILRINSNVDLIKMQSTNSEERNNQTYRILINHLQEIHIEHGVKKEHLKNITNLLTGLHLNRSDAYALSDAPTLPEEGLKIIKNEISDEGHKIGAKMHNMYNDLWKTIKNLEELIRNALEENNQTNKELFNKLTNKILEEQGHSENFMDVVIRGALENVGDRLGNFQRQIESRLKEFKASQEKQGETCHKIKSFIEDNVGFILGKIYDTFTNRTDKSSKQLEEVADMIKALNKQLIQSTIETKNVVITLADDNSQDHKQLDASIGDVSESLQDIQMQTQEISEMFLKNQAAFREVKNLIFSSQEKQNLLNSSNVPNIKDEHAIEANYSNGVIKINTDPFTSNEGASIENKPLSVSLETLNKSIITTDLEAIIGDLKDRKDDEGELQTKMEKEDEDGYEAHEERSFDEEKPIDVTQLLLTYIKLLNDHLTPQEFLAEAVPGNSYETFDDMVKHMKKTKNIPREIIYNIEQLALDEKNKDSLHSDWEARQIIKKLTQNKEFESEDENYDDDE